MHYALLLLTVCFFSCSGNSSNDSSEEASTSNTTSAVSDTPEVTGTATEIADTWCQLMHKEFQAKNSGDAAKIKTAEEATTAYQQKIEEKYKGDDAMMKEIINAMATCDAALEGRK